MTVEVSPADNLDLVWVQTVRSMIIVDAGDKPDVFALIMRDETPRFEAEERFERSFNANPAPGLGRHYAKLFFSPSKPTESGIIWGAGPVFLLPSATDEFLGSGKLGAGPMAVVLKQDGPWTFGMLANHVWSFAVQSDRADVNSTFLQPFISYTTKDAWT